jgi:LmbE family N-acetylglucosaminyl deacetylase
VISSLERRIDAAAIRPASALVIVAHADDAEFGVAGTVYQWTRQGTVVDYVVCTNGDRGTSDRSLSQADLAQMRMAEQRNAASTIGVRDVVFLGYPDGGIEPSAELMKDLVAQIRHFRPEVVICPDPYRAFFPFVSHRDHRGVGQAATDAAFPLAGQRWAFPDLLQRGYEPHQVQAVLHIGAQEPNVWVDIAPHFETKIDALMCHASQISDREQLTYMARNLAAQLAENHGVELAEAFRYETFDWESGSY